MDAVSHNFCGQAILSTLNGILKGGPVANQQLTWKCNLALTFFIVDVRTGSAYRNDHKMCQAHDITSPSQQLWADLKHLAAVAAYRFLRGSGRVPHIAFRPPTTSSDTNQRNIIPFLTLECQNNYNATSAWSMLLKDTPRGSVSLMHYFEVGKSVNEPGCVVIPVDLLSACS